MATIHFNSFMFHTVCCNDNALASWETALLAAVIGCSCCVALSVAHFSMWSVVCCINVQY